VNSERFRTLIETNFFGVVFMTRATIPIMRQQKEWMHSADLIGRRPACDAGKCLLTMPRNGP
jgi:NAD(P)-dependent dehydrogenase (short-subunit alcohol dehydrogenase family)